MARRKVEREIVVFRKWRDGGNIIALFPCEPCDILNRTCSSYMHIGQHGAAVAATVVARTMPATRAEYADLARELRTIGYKLDVRRRCPPIGYLKSERARRNTALYAGVSGGK